MRQKNQLHAALNEVQHSAVCDLRGKTKTGVRLELAARVDLRQDYVHAQAGEKPREEGIEGVCRQRLGNTDAGSVGCGIAAGMSKDQFASLFHQIGRRYDARLSLPDVFIQAAAAAEGKAPPGDFEMIDAAIHRTGPAGESTGTFHLRFGQSQ